MARATRSGGFSLVELLMVIAVVAVCAAIVTPRLGGTIRVSRLKAAARTVVRAGRYARSMAVLKQRDFELTLDVGGRHVRVSAAGDTGRASGSAEERAEEHGAAEQAEFPVGLSRELEGAVIERVEFPETGEEIKEGRCTILYSLNGRCTPYIVHLANDVRQSARVKVDALCCAETALGL